MSAPASWDHRLSVGFGSFGGFVLSPGRVHCFAARLTPLGRRKSNLITTVCTGGFGGLPGTVRSAKVISSWAGSTRIRSDHELRSGSSQWPVCVQPGAMLSALSRHTAGSVHFVQF